MARIRSVGMAGSAVSARPLYQSGHCGIGRHGACWGNYAGEDCHCQCRAPKESQLRTMGTGSAQSNYRAATAELTP
jgi:hypothetical protein